MQVSGRTGYDGLEEQQGVKPRCFKGVRRSKVRARVENAIDMMGTASMV